MLRIVYAENFISQFESLTLKIQTLAYKKMEIFKNNPRHSSLRTHKLHGYLDGYFSFSVDHQTRVVFEYGEKDTVHFLKIGNHEVYR